MPLKFSDPGIIIRAYESILANECNWLLLKYSDFDELSLLSFGSQGLEELKLSIDDVDQVFIGFYREDLETGHAFVLINYIPLSISGVKRAHTLVHSRNVGAMFKKHQTTLTVDDLNSLTPDAIQQALREPDSLSFIQMGRTISQPTDVTTKPLQPVRRSFSETNAPTTIVPPPVAKSAGIFSNIIRRKKRTDESLSEDETMPPPTPPKDKGKFSVPQVLSHPNQPDYAVYSTYTQSIPHDRSISELAVISHSKSSEEVIVEPIHSSQVQNPIFPLLPLRGKWAPTASNPTDRERQRREAQDRRKMEEEEILREELNRQAELKRRKDEEIREEIEAEARRRVLLEDELKFIAAERKRKEWLEKEEDERKKREIEERKRLDKERRLEEHRRLELWRREQARLADEALRHAHEAKKREENERRKKIQVAEARIKRSNVTDSVLTGWVTIQMKDSLVWKRRFFKFIGSIVYFYRSPEDMHQILDRFELRGKLLGLKEWNEGYEELEAIPHSFAVDFKDNDGSWLMYADSEEEKYKLLGLIQHAAGL